MLFILVVKNAWSMLHLKKLAPHVFCCFDPSSFFFERTTQDSACFDPSSKVTTGFFNLVNVLH
jgi:hypothetical protein